MSHALVIDDNPLNLDVLKMLLEQQEIQVTALRSPREVDAALADGPDFKLVFLDLELPNANGLDLLPQLRTHPALRQARFVAYTVHTSEINEVRDAGFDAFLGKPLSSQRFPDQIRRILAGQSVFEV